MGQAEGFQCIAVVENGEDGRVSVHPQLKKIYQKAVELGWVGASYNYEHGGMQLPSGLSGLGKKK